MAYLCFTSIFLCCVFFGIFFIINLLKSTNTKYKYRQGINQPDGTVYTNFSQLTKNSQLWETTVIFRVPDIYWQQKKVKWNNNKFTFCSDVSKLYAALLKFGISHCGLQKIHHQCAANWIKMKNIHSLLGQISYKQKTLRENIFPNGKWIYSVFSYYLNLYYFSYTVFCCCCCCACVSLFLFLFLYLVVWVNCN